MENGNVNVPYIVFESDMARMERAHKRLWILIIILIVVLVASNVGWLLYESQFETITETSQQVWQEADNSGSNQYIGGDLYGETDN